MLEYDSSYYLVVLSSDGANNSQLGVYAFDALLGELRLNFTSPLPPSVASPVSSFHALRSRALPSFVAVTSRQSLSLFLTPSLGSWQQLSAHRSFVLRGKGSEDMQDESVSYSCWCGRAQQIRCWLRVRCPSAAAVIGCT